MNAIHRREDESFNPAQKNLHVLIVEDDPLSRTALQTLLSAYGYPTRAAASAEEALSSVYDGDAQMIALIDLDLPGMDGAQLLKRLRASSPELHAVMITAASKDRVRELTDDEHLPYLRKPLDFQCLLCILSEESGQPPLADL